MELFVNNQGVQVHCIVAHQNPNEIPLIIIPGNINSANEVHEDLQGKLKHYHIIVSLHGRGKSSVPEQGYRLEDQASDILAVIDHFKLTAFYMLGHSVGSSIAIAACAERVNATKGFIIGDFSPYYPPYDKSWADNVKKHASHLNPTFLKGLVADAKLTSLKGALKQLECPILTLRGEQRSAIPPEIVTKFTDEFPNGTVKVLTDIDHDIFANPDALVERLTHFLDGIAAEKIVSA